MAVRGGNPFRSRAYERGARALERLPEDLGALVATDRLTSVRDIGPALAAVITELHSTGRTSILDRLRRELPPGILELIEVPSLTLPRIEALHRALGIDGVAALRAACEAGLVRTVSGFGVQTEAKILAGIQKAGERASGMRLHHALELGEGLLAHLRASPHVLQAEIAGALRRRHETIGRIELVVATDDEAGAGAHFLRFPRVSEPAAATPGRYAGRLPDGTPIELQTAGPSEYPLVLSHATGSEGHWTRLQSLARDRGLVLSERRLERGGLAVDVGDEAGLYRGIGLPFVPPELREGDGEIEAALAGELPPDLVAQGDVQGFVHCHTRYSDGRNTVEEMARAAEALGLSYITITDHSPSAHYAGGLTLDRLERQWDEIARVQETVRIRLLRGTESDILADGSLDYPDAVLEQLDVVIASIHSRLKMDEDAMTRRLVRAMRLPCFKVWGHALGRLVERRPPLECRLEEVLDAAAESRVAIEVNGDPHRLDMAPAGLRKARARGIPFVISTDAHSVADLGYLRYGVDTARRGWVRRGEVLNVLSADDFQRAVRPAG